MNDDDKKMQLAREQTALSRTRTGWSEDRVLLANERTFASWMRTGMSSLAVGIGLQAVFYSTEPAWAAKVVASFFIAIGIVIFLTGALYDSKAQRRVNEHDAETMPARLMWLMAWMLSGASLATGIVLWLT